MTSTRYQGDNSYNKYNKYEHIYCSGCHHSLYFIKNYPAICSYCGTVVYPSKRCEFKAKMKKEMIKNKEKSNE